MRGAEEARKLVTARLAAAMPAKVAELVARYALPAAAPAGDPDLPGTLPNVRLFKAGEKVALAADQWPALLTVPLTVPTVTFADIVDGHVVWKVTYRLRTYVYVQGFADSALELDAEDDAGDKRDRYLLGVRELLLVDLNLGDDGARVGLPWTESYSGVEPADIGSVAAGYVEYAVTLEELADKPRPPGTPADPGVATVELTVLPPHPALD